MRKGEGRVSWWNPDSEELAEIEGELEEAEQAGWTTQAMVAGVIRQLQRMEKTLMATLQDVIDAVDQDKAAVEAAAARVTTDLAALSAQVADLQAQLDGGSGVTAADLQAVKDGLDAVTGEASAIDAPPAP